MNLIWGPKAPISFNFEFNMIKYKDYYIVFEEIPDKVTLAINITNCQNRCVGCHSPELRRDIGTELTKCEIDRIISENDGINCICFMGEGNDREALKEIADYVIEKHHIDIALYSGRKEVESDLYGLFDFVKVGPYIEEFGPLNKETTNQRLYYVQHCQEGNLLTDITSMFWEQKK